MRNFATVVLASLMILSFVTTVAAEKAVTIKGAIQPAVGTGSAGHFTITVRMDIKQGWHICAEAGEGSEEPTSLKMKLPEGAKAEGNWKRPVAAEGAELHSQIYVGKVSFSKTIFVDPSAHCKSIDVVVSYQACTDEFCNPPQTKTISIAIPVDDSASPSIFEHPVRLMVADVPLNNVAKKRFPSPGIFDVDGDSKAELVIGGLMGSVGVYENLNSSGTGDPVWGSRESLKDVKGKPIRTSNW